MRLETLDYSDSSNLYKGFYANNESNSPKPAILVCHDWSGLNDFAKNKAKALADLGYIGFAADLFGNGRTGTTKEEKSALITPLVNDRALLRDRLQTALNFLKTLDGVNPDKIAAIGFCFGGLCVLDIARSGEDLRGVVSFHGLLHAPENLPTAKIKARVLALHGYNDPMVPPATVNAFADEMTKAQADWQLTMYGNTMHAFMNPQANDPVLGTVYNPKIEPRAWLAMRNFLEEVFD